MIDQRTAPWAALLLRVTLGSLFIAHLYWKFAILPGGLNTWWANFATNKYPSITPWYCISAEILGAVLLIPGAAHYWTIRKGFFFVGAGAELPVAWAVMLVVQALLGDGPYALVQSSAAGRYFKTA
jgi:putative oxidoreductase